MSALAGDCRRHYKASTPPITTTQTTIITTIETFTAIPQNSIPIPQPKNQAIKSFVALAISHEPQTHTSHTTGQTTTYIDQSQPPKHQELHIFSNNFVKSKNTLNRPLLSVVKRHPEDPVHDKNIIKNLLYLSSTKRGQSTSFIQVFVDVNSQNWPHTNLLQHHTIMSLSSIDIIINAQIKESRPRTWF